MDRLWAATRRRRGLLTLNALARRAPSSARKTMPACRLYFESSSLSWINQISSSDPVDRHCTAYSRSIQITVFIGVVLIRWPNQRSSRGFRAIRLPVADDFQSALTKPCFGGDFETNIAFVLFA
jgi:hypothetical protein